MDDNRAENQQAENERFLKLFAANQKRILGYIYSLVPQPRMRKTLPEDRHRAVAQNSISSRVTVTSWLGPAEWPTLEVCNFRRTSSRDRLYFSDELLAYLAEDRIEDLSNTNRRFDAFANASKGSARLQRN